MENPTTQNVLDKLTVIESLLVATQPKPLTLKEAAEFLDFSRSYLYRLTSQGRIPCYNFDRAELVDWLKRNRNRTQEETEEKAASYIVNH
jgi:excisionase family DNA binding protein